MHANRSWATLRHCQAGPTRQKCLAHQHADGVRHRLRSLRQPDGITTDNPYPRRRRRRGSPIDFRTHESRPCGLQGPWRGLGTGDFSQQTRMESKAGTISPTGHANGIRKSPLPPTTKSAPSCKIFAVRGYRFRAIADALNKQGFRTRTDRQRMEQDPGQTSRGSVVVRQSRRTIPTFFLLLSLNCDPSRRIRSHRASLPQRGKGKARRGGLTHDLGVELSRK